MIPYVLFSIFRVFDHTSCGKNDVQWYGLEETDSIDVQGITKNCDLIVLIKDGFRKTCYLNTIHMLNRAPQCFAF